MTKIYVGNLGFQTTDQELRATFSQFGEVGEVMIIKDRETGRSRGFAFVEMINDEDARKAISELNGSELDGRALNVSEARPKEEAGERGGGFGGRRRGGRF